MLVGHIAELVKDKRVEGISDIRDETDRNGMRIVIEFRRDANGQIILNQLYKFTDMQATCSAIMIALVNGVPKCLSLKEMLTIRQKLKMAKYRVNYHKHQLYKMESLIAESNEHTFLKGKNLNETR